MGVGFSTPSRNNLRPWLIVLVGVSLLSFLPVALLKSNSGGSSTTVIAGSSAGRIAYIEFGSKADTVWLADPLAPRQRQKLLEIDHALDYGIVAAPSPDGKQIAYTALTPGGKASPAPDTPADLWVSELTSGAKPRRIAEGVDLLVKPVWSPDASSIAVRRSTGAGKSVLLLVDVATGSWAEVVRENAALFPVGFGFNDEALYYVRIQPDASDFMYASLRGEYAPVVQTHLADGLTRDWTLLPGGDLAFLKIDVENGRFVTYPYIAYLNTARSAAVPVDKRYIEGEAFAPVWRDDGSLTFGRPPQGVSGTGVLVTSSFSTRPAFAPPPTPSAVEMAPPATGFDVPAGWSDDGSSLAVRTFEGASATSPGRSSLAVVSNDGARHTIATGEVTFLGWITP